MTSDARLRFVIPLAALSILSTPAWAQTDADPGADLGDVTEDQVPDVEVDADVDVEEPEVEADGEGAEVEVDEVGGLPPTSAPTVSAVRLVELPELLEAARENADGLQAAEAKVRNAEWTEYRARYAWAPVLQADTFAAPVPADTDINEFSNNLDSITAFNIGPFIRQTATLVVPVFTFGRITAARALAAIGVENAEIEVRKAELDLVYQVKRAYYGLQVARTLDAMIVDGVGLVNDTLDEMDEARKFGEATFEVKDFRRLQIFEAELASRALDNEKLVRLGLAGIAYLTDESLSLDNIAPLDEGVEPAPLATLQVYQYAARATRPELAQLDRAVAARDHQLDLQRAEFFPNIVFLVNFSLGWSTEQISRQRIQREVAPGQFEDTDLSSAPFINAYDNLGLGVGLGIRWRFNLIQLRGEYKEVEALGAQTRHQREQATGAIMLEIESLWVDASQARARIEIQARRLEAARRWRDQLGFGASLTGEEIGDIDVTEAIEPLRAYYEAKLLHLQAITEYRIARAALAKGIGVTDLAPFDPAPEAGEGDEE